MRAPTVILALAGALLGGCGGDPGPAAPVAIGWRFVDGRRCADAGAQTVTITLDDVASGPATGYSCAGGDQGRTIVIAPIPAGTRVGVTARSAPGDPLYRGESTLPSPIPPSLSVLLYYTAGR